MELNVWTIFLFLAIGAVVGFEFGKAAALRRVKTFTASIAESMQKTVEEKKKEQQLKKQEFDDFIKTLASIKPIENDENKE